MGRQYLKKEDISIRRRPADARKGQHGRCLVIGGSDDLAGAPALAGMAALRSGCDIVEVAAPERVAWTLNGYAPDLITIKMPGRTLSMRHIRRLRELISRADAILLGNGLGKRDRFVSACIQAVKEEGITLVLDADAIGANPLQDLKDCILTPHQGELERLAAISGISPTPEAIQGIMRNEQMVLLKGTVDLIITHDRIYRNRTGNPGMAKGGTGDILAGMCAGFVAQGYGPAQACINAAYLTGYFGDLAFKEKGYALTATDIINRIRV